MMAPFRKPDFGTREESRKLSASEQVTLWGIKQDAKRLISVMGSRCPPCPETVLAQRKVQEAVFWASFAITGMPETPDASAALVRHRDDHRAVPADGPNAVQESPHADSIRSLDDIATSERIALSKMRRRLIELQCAHSSGKLIDREEAARILFDSSRHIRNRLTVVPDKIGDQIDGKGKQEIVDLAHELILEALSAAADETELICEIGPHSTLDPIYAIRQLIDEVGDLQIWMNERPALTASVNLAEAAITVFLETRALLGGLVEARKDPDLDIFEATDGAEELLERLNGSIPSPAESESAP